MAALRELNVNTLLSSTNLSASSANKATKRPREEEDLDDVSDDDVSDDDEDLLCKWDCNQIRNKINALIRSGEMKVTEFQRINSINSNSYGRFMKLKGPMGGIDNQTYYAGHKFFLRRERQGLKAPKAKKSKPEDLAKFDVSSVHFEDEELEDIPIFDTCDDLRTKIQAHLRNPGVTQAALCRAIGSMYSPPRSVQSKQLSDFLKKKGATSGNTSVVYYGGFVYFEKLRIKNRQPKTKKRMDVELNQPDGMPREARYATKYVSSANFGVFEDSFGRVYSAPL